MKRTRNIGFAGLRSSAQEPGSNTQELGNFDDWYAVKLEAGPVTVSIDRVPLDLSLQARLQNHLGEWIGEATHGGATASASVHFQEIIASPGDYFVWVGIDVIPAMARSARLPRDTPDYFTRPYSRVVSQSR